ncbi:efflux RND transporter permease subunit [Treponema parvum]|uniref:Efflux RND transporter permease subunit n=1 Tax=Treponema parvum TaxID=138851 RepID=A0A975EXU0_9SPIR|nr:efflux RND transporter permease subunit [Treponema parvum]QTQ10911.1 efflux RND transporter permease subunit [Treponema parvum]
MSISEVSVKKPVTALLVFIILSALGVYSIFNLNVDMYPEIDIPYLIVYTGYKNAGPEEVEASITRTLESSLSGLSGLKKMQSQSSTGLSLIILEMEYGTNLDAAANDIRDKIDMVRSYLPSDADTPLTIKIDPSMMPIMHLVLKGQHSSDELYDYASDIISPRLEQIDGVASAMIMGGRKKTINVDIPRDRLDAYGLTISQVAQMIGAQNIQATGGNIRSEQLSYSVKTDGKFKSIEDVRNTVISYAVASSPGGKAAPSVKKILLRDIADVYEGHEDGSTAAYLDGESSIMLLVQKQSGKNAVKTAANVRAALKNITESLPGDVEVIESSNTTDQIKRTIIEVVKSITEGMILSVIILLIFLRSIKSTVIIGLAIPISFLITLFLMFLRGMTINMVSLGGMLIGVGMLVDNSIVVLENIFVYRERDAKPSVAATLGAQEMITSVVASTLTSICIFLPMIMLSSRLGFMGQLFNDLAFTIVFSLLGSLFVAIALVPVLSAKYLVLGKSSNINTHTLFGKLNRALGIFFERVDGAYASSVRRILRHKAATVIVMIAIFIGAIVGAVKVGFIYMPEIASDTVTVKFELPKGTRLEVTEAYVQQMESIARQEVKGIKFSTVTAGGDSMLSSSATTNEGSLTLTLYPKAERQKGWDTDKTAKDKLRPYFTKFPGATITFGTNNNDTANSGISIDIKSNDLSLVAKTANQVMNLIKTQAADVVNEVTCDLEEGLPQLEIKLDRNRMYELGLNVASIGSEISGAINGLRASRYDDGGKEINIVVRLPEKDRAKVTDLDLIYVRNNSGTRIPLSNFAHTVKNTAPVTIFRENQSRIAHVTVKQVDGLSLGDVQNRIKDLIDKNILMEDDLNITYSGDLANMREAVMNFLAIIIMAIVLVFAVMASQFESFKSPFIIMFTIPLSFIGVTAIYALTRQRFSIMTVMGVLTLVGTIVNNGIVLIDQINILRKRGRTLDDACVEAAGNRLRPILMSTLTTVFSLIPMAFFPGEGSESMQPIGLTIFGGMTFGSLMTLFLMPVVYNLFNRKNERARVEELKRIEQENA